MKRKIIAIGMITVMWAFAICGCQDKEDNNKNENSKWGDKTTITESVNETGTIEKYDIDVTYSDKEKLSLTKGDLSNYTNTIELKNKDVSITKSGEYVLSGEISDGQIIVDVPDSDDKVVTLILNGVNVNCSDSAAIYVKNAKKVVLSLVEGTTNSFSDGNSYVYDDTDNEEPNSCIFSKDDLAISGNGSLLVNGNFNNGIYSKDDLTITGGKIEVKAVNNGIKGKDSIAILSAAMSIDAGGDGMSSSNGDDEGKGFISIETGNFKIVSGEDGIQAETCLEIKGGNYDITTGEGATTTSWDNEDEWGKLDFGEGLNREDFSNESGTNSSLDAVSIKGIKAGANITINGGEYIINAEDDAIHTNGDIEIIDGIFDIKSGDDGLHADDILNINGGEITVNQCYEGIEATYITVNDGNIYVISRDDGFNAAGGNDSSSIQGRPGGNMFSNSTGNLTFNGGYVYVNSSGDGLDANGTLEITEGYIIVDGPASGGNGALDYDSSCKITGGFLIAVGYSQMAQMPTEAEVNCVMIGFDEYISDGKLINIADADNNSIITFKGTKSYNNMLICTSIFTKGEDYTVSVGGSVDGDVVDGVCSGEYTEGTVFETFTINGESTTVGNATDGMGGFGPGGQMPGGQMPGGDMQKPGGGRH